LSNDDANAREPTAVSFRTLFWYDVCSGQFGRLLKDSQL